MSEQRGRIEVVKAGSCSRVKAGWSDVNVRRPTVLGSPFRLRAEADRDASVENYWLLLKGDRSAHELGRAAGLQVDEQAGRVPHAHRIAALRQLARRVESGEKLRLVCACRPKACHGDLIREWILRELQMSEL